MSLSYEQTRLVMEGLEENLRVESSAERERRAYSTLRAISVTEVFIVIAVRLAIAAGLAYIAWNCWSSNDVFNGLFRLTIGDIGRTILAVLCALAIPFALVAPWK